MDADDFAVRKHLGQDVQRHAVVGIVKGGHQHQAVGDVEIGIAGRQALAAEDHRARHGQLDNVNCLPSSVRAALRRSRFSASGSWFGSLVSGSTAVTIVAGADEAGDVVDVAVGVVAGNAAAEPDHLIDAEVIVKDLLQLLAADAGIALLHLAQQALFGGEQNAVRR